jgi:heme/copper-type cytochrome/quinol oxidase subunit 2
MAELIIILLILILVGSLIYFFRFRNKEKPKVGLKRNNFSEYVKDYTELKLYWTSIAFIVVGIVVLIAIGIMELAFA